ncbi:hypothetical protein JCM6292_2872 [Bacteroides pyogenes JCM 6292]|uniref:Uncharacterized protein n=1 Tax=Bacteroides pyogenes JCM 6292 TaxID=1235809 RepID=W4PAP9_9BACE|nr:hypothetical protein JCM6292_2872 [Bacteroides pyogenes JCM 6292]
MNKFNPEILKHGYLIVPKMMLQKLNDASDCRDGDFEAFLKMLMKVNYTDMKIDTGTNKGLACGRGESCTATATGARCSAGRWGGRSASSAN